MSCYNCGSGLHEECIDISEGKCCCEGNPDPVAELELEETQERKRRSRDATLRDQQSTGRKRAAELFPLDREQPCEWKTLKNAGGGNYPIIGCRSGLQQARHHGPDKNTLNNEDGNVHRICHTCHNRWHTRNDPTYIPGEIVKQHDFVTKATAEEIIDNELWWSTRRINKAKD